MKLKSYFTNNVETAMDMARKELGEDALLVNARPATPETRYLGAYEVVFGLARAPQPQRDPQRDPQLDLPPAQVPAVRGFVENDLAGQLARLQRQMDRLSANLPPATRQPPVDFGTDARLGRVVALVGPPGAGKTTTLVKLAARYGLACGRRPHILTADVFRIAAADQLRSLAALLGIGCDVVETPLAMAQALEENQSKELILIDTPGLGFGDLEDGEDLARMLGSVPDIDTHLVLAASTEPSALERLASTYQMFRPAKLIFTRLDETTKYAMLTAQAARSGLPISFLSTGQQIPDDLEEATRERLLAFTASASAAAPVTPMHAVKGATA